MQYERSIWRCKIALIIKTAMADQQGKYQCYLAFGKTYNSLGQYIKAIHSANRSLKMGEELEIGDESPSSIIGNPLYYQGPFENSIEYFTKDLPICKAPRDHCGEGDYCGLIHFGKIRIIYYKRVLKVYLTLLIHHSRALSRWLLLREKHFLNVFHQAVPFMREWKQGIFKDN